MPSKLTSLRRALALHRLERRLSYQQLADEIGGVSQQTVFRFIEQETTEPHATTIYAIEQYLKTQGIAA